MTSITILNIKATYSKLTNYGKAENKGFTLLEVVIAITLIGTAMVMLLGAISNNINLAAKSKNDQVAALLAEKMMAEIELEEKLYKRQESGTFPDHKEFKWFLSVSPYNIPFLNTKVMIVRLLITWDNDNAEFEIFTAVAN